MNDDIQRPNTLKTILIIHLALLTGQTIFAFIAFYINNSIRFELDTRDSYFFVSIALVTGSLVASNVLFKKNLDYAIQQSDVNSKLVRYQTSLIIRYALLEGASLFNIVVYFIGGNLFYLVVSTVIILYFLSLRPSKERVMDDLQLSYDEAQTL